MSRSLPFFHKDVFWKRYRQLQAYLRKRLPHDEVEDVIQTAMYRLVKADQSLLSSEWILAWLYRVVTNESVDLLRKKKPTSLADYMSPEQLEFFDDTLGAMLSDNVRPEDEVLRAVFWEEFEAALDDLPCEQRQVFERTELMGESYKSLSKETGVPVNTLISRKRYALLRLRPRLELLRQEILNS